jgi:calcineurin-like phosphoesterase family protein
MRFSIPAQKAYFTSDTHFGHLNIIQHSHRPFSSIEEMDEVMIKNWNYCVSNSDVIFFLGDFSYRSSEEKANEILSQLRGQKILIYGNHDEDFVYKQKHSKFRSFWNLIAPRLDLTVLDGKEKQLLVLHHYAQRVWNKSHYGSWHLYGHSHNQLPEISGSLSFDIGVDCHEYRPWNYVEVKEKMMKKMEERK